jgi:hypothetical protein
MATMSTDFRMQHITGYHESQAKENRLTDRYIMWVVVKFADVSGSWAWVKKLSRVKTL